MWENLGALCTTVVGKILLAVIVYLVGRFIIGKLVGLVEKAKGLAKLDANVRSFTLSAVKWALYVILIVSIIAILGVPMASVVAVLGAAGAAIALGLQGSLANLAGGIMLVIFKPFKIGDFVETAGVSGVVKEISNEGYLVVRSNGRVNIDTVSVNKDHSISLMISRRAARSSA